MQRPQVYRTLRSVVVQTQAQEVHLGSTIRGRELQQASQQEPERLCHGSSS